MAKAKNPGTNIVYSTNPEYEYEHDEANIETLLPEKQGLRIMLDKKQRAGKSVTLIKGFKGKEEDLESLGKKLKTFCGTGGSVKNNEIIIQGDNREKAHQWLLKNGYELSKKI
ncbi:MAG: translation initiation factor [Ferruginibacter sp.]